MEAHHKLLVVDLLLLLQVQVAVVYLIQVWAVLLVVVMQVEILVHRQQVHQEVEVVMGQLVVLDQEILEEAVVMDQLHPHPDQ
jgi:hypothetical protein